MNRMLAVMERMTAIMEAQSAMMAQIVGIGQAPVVTLAEPVKNGSADGIYDAELEAERRKENSKWNGATLSGELTEAYRKEARITTRP